MFSIFKSKDNTEELNKIYQALNSVEEFIDRDSNGLALNEEIKDKALSAIYDKIKSISAKLEKKNSSVLGVNGELLLLIEKMADGDFSDRVHLQTDDPYLRYFAKSLNIVSRKLHRNFREILNILKEYENGKYINSLSTDEFRDGEVKEFIRGINNLKDSISSILRENLTFGYKLEKTSNDLGEKMRIVLDASDEQAKTLDDITFKVTNIQEKAKQTTTYTKDIQNSSKRMKESTHKSLSYANKTVTAMEDINSSTVAISEAIEVIDQIAFQTNILSLNAAVEAATAGDAGKGFAVVASEVRNLASRSADAAKSIKELVEVATQKANEGKEISDSMIDGYKELSSSIDEISSIIDKATISTDEQLHEVQSIHKTVNDLQSKTKNFVSIAHHTNEVSQNLQEISQKILTIANKTEFEGKDEILEDVEVQREKELELA